jgi:2-deoxy-D-gluconate 3-dehydrogenase
LIALVTGGSRGIGAAMVQALRDAGHTVAVIARSKQAIDCDMYIQRDLTDEYFYPAGVIEQVVSTLGGLDVLVNNAGAQHHESTLTYSLTDWRKQLELMLTVPFVLSQAAAGYMLEHNGGHIVNVLSTSAFQGARYIPGYVAAKHGLLGLTRAMAIEFAPKVHINGIAPGLTQTSMVDEYIPADRRRMLESITPAGRFGQPEEIAGALLYILGASYLYGQTITVDGGWSVKNIA